ncbi:hypothetical protein JL100_008770 [Skermanella mucosa]|uniref:hypothetical protein n=1 Tax=Skermanella mucosa TaxID=1789672 RepID=UPI001E613F4E|nr:hypothetical protein [Skermanella mucosa]UEM22821.1 hypothetical protein JL100_008770 [Skermanella mucosa]
MSNYPGVMGYTDILFLNQLFYVPFRLLGADQFMAFQATLIATTVVGYVSFYVLLRNFLNVSYILSCAFATMFAFSNISYLKAGHPQLYAIYFVPVLIMALLSALDTKQRSMPMACAYAAFSGCLWASLLFTSFYVGWFFIVVVFFFLALSPLVDREVVILLLRARAQIASFVVAFLLAMVPFVVTYLPALSAGRKRSYTENLNFTGELSDLINVGEGNLVWGNILKNLPGYPVERLVNSEAALGVAPFLAATLVVGVFLVWRNLPVGQSRHAGRSRLIIMMALTFAVLTVISVQVDGYSLWWLVWKFLPGGSAIRVPFRLQILSNMIAMITVALILQNWYERFRAAGSWHGGPLLLGVMMPVFLAEQVNLTLNSGVQRRDELAELAAVPQPLSDCRVFYVIHEGSPRPSWAVQIDAMLISQKIGVPTANGYSGWIPLHWDAIDPKGPGYVQSMDNWLGINGLAADACVYDLVAKVWTTHSAVRMQRTQALSPSALKDLTLSVASLQLGTGTATLTVGLTNGSNEWAFRRSANPLRLSWRMASGLAPDEPGWNTRIDVPANVGPGQSIVVPVAFPWDGRAKQIELSLVVEGRYWAHDFGTAPLVVSLPANGD